MPNTICGRTISPENAALIGARRYEETRDVERIMDEASSRTLRILQDLILGKDDK